MLAGGFCSVGYPNSNRAWWRSQIYGVAAGIKTNIAKFWCPLFRGMPIPKGSKHSRWVRRDSARHFPNLMPETNKNAPRLLPPDFRNWPCVLLRTGASVIPSITEQGFLMRSRWRFRFYSERTAAIVGLQQEDNLI